jgi:DNA replication protein DnaC
VTASDVAQYYADLRSLREEEAEERRDQVYGEVPRIKEIEDKEIRLNSQISKIIISNTVDKKEVMEKIKTEIESLNMEKAFLLTDNGFEVDYMDVKYDCPECRDTGILDTGERCQCFGEVTREKIAALAAQTNKLPEQKTE